MSNALVLKHGFDATLVKLGFYPSMISPSRIAIADPVNDRELHFETEAYRFKEYPARVFAERNHIPDTIKNVIIHKNEWFDEFAIVAPERQRDPFLFGVKDGKYYFICSWDTDIWESVE